MTLTKHQLQKLQRENDQFRARNQTLADEVIQLTRKSKYALKNVTSTPTFLRSTDNYIRIHDEQQPQLAKPISPTSSYSSASAFQSGQTSPVNSSFEASPPPSPTRSIAEELFRPTEPLTHNRFRRDVGTLKHFEPYNPITGTGGQTESTNQAKSEGKQRTPYATDQSYREQLESTSKMEQELMTLSLEKSKVK